MESAFLLFGNSQYSTLHFFWPCGVSNARTSSPPCFQVLYFYHLPWYSHLMESLGVFLHIWWVCLSDWATAREVYSFSCLFMYGFILKKEKKSLLQAAFSCRFTCVWYWLVSGRAFFLVLDRSHSYTDKHTELSGWLERTHLKLFSLFFRTLFCCIAFLFHEELKKSNPWFVCCPQLKKKKSILYDSALKETKYCVKTGYCVHVSAWIRSTFVFQSFFPLSLSLRYASLSPSTRAGKGKAERLF